MQPQFAITEKAVNNTLQLSLLLPNSPSRNTTSFGAVVRCQIALFPKCMTTLQTSLCMQYIPQCLVSLVLPRHAWIHDQHPLFHMEASFKEIEC